MLLSGLCVAAAADSSSKRGRQRHGRRVALWAEKSVEDEEKAMGAVAEYTAEMDKRLDKFQKKSREEADEREAEMDKRLDEFQRSISRDLEEKSRDMTKKIDRLLSRAEPRFRDSMAREGDIDEGREEAVARGETLDPGLARLVVCSTETSAVGQLFFQRVEAVTSEADKPIWLDLTEAPLLPFEELDLLFSRCRAVVFCPDTDSEDRRSLEAVRAGVKASLNSLPNFTNKAVLLSRVGAQSIKGGINMRALFGMSYDGTFAGLEDLLTSSARRRAANRPLNVTIVRVGSAQTAEAPMGAGRPVSILAADARGPASTSAETAADALMRVLVLGVNTSMCVVGDSAATAESAVPWRELLLPYIGPEIWRAEVPNARRAAIFAQGWAEEWFGGEKGLLASRFGVKTPVEVATTPTGVIFKFRPHGTPSGREFKDLEEGGLEFIAETQPDGQSRLRVKRCAYGWKVVTKENSERALLQKFSEDWAKVATQ